MKLIKLTLVFILFSCTSSATMSYDEMVDTCVAHIKKYEGFRSEYYFDASGNKCIGYGHLIKNGENYTKITKTQGHEILKKDFLKLVTLIKKDTGLESNKLLAMSLFSYNVGIGYFYKSSLFKAVKRNEAIDGYILKYGYYFKNKKAIKSPKLMERRQFELWLYNL